MSVDLFETLFNLGADLNGLIAGKHFHDRESIGEAVPTYTAEKNDAYYASAEILPQTVSAGNGQELLSFSPDEVAPKRAPYPAKWGKGLLAVEVRGDSMSGIHLFDGDLAYFKPGEIRGDGIYVIQVDGEALVKRLEFDKIGRKIIIASENPRYQSKTESQDSQAFTILGKVRGWMHEHPY